MRNDLKNIIDYFCGKLCPIPREICLEILLLSGNVRVGKRSISYVTHYLPAFRGRIWTERPPMDYRRYYKLIKPDVVYKN